MGEGDQSSTSASLLAQLRGAPADPRVWGRFVDRYGAQVFRWCRRWGCQEADAEDVTQTVLLELARQMRDFEYDPAGSFRGWLRTIAYRAWGKLLEARRRPGGGTGTDAVLDLLNAVPAGESLVDYLDAEGERELLEIASGRVRLRVQPRTWEAFRLTALEGKSGAEAGAVLNMQPGAVFVARSQVQRLLREEVARLERPE